MEGRNIFNFLCRDFTIFSKKIIKQKNNLDKSCTEMVPFFFFVLLGTGRTTPPLLFLCLRALEKKKYLLSPATVQICGLENIDHKSMKQVSYSGKYSLSASRAHQSHL